MSHAVFKSALSAGLFASCIFSSYVVAEELPTVVVSATRSEQSNLTIPSSITIIGRDQIEKSGATNIVDLLRGHTGLVITDTFGDGSKASVGIRGFGETANSNTLVLIDGRRANNPDISSPDLYSISIIDVERVEIVYGSSGVLYGDQAVGGVLNIITRDPTKDRAELEVSYGSYDNVDVKAFLSGLAENGYFYKVVAEDRQSDNYRDHNEKDFQQLLARLGYNYAKGSVFAEMQYIDDKLETAGGMFQSHINVNRKQSLANFQGDFSNAKTNIGRLVVDHEIVENWLLEAELTSRRMDGVFRLSSITGTPETEDAYQNREIYEFTPRFVGMVPSGEGDILITIGSDIINSDYFLSSRMGDQSNDQDVFSFFAHAVVPLNANLNMTVGARYSEVENFLKDSFTFTTGQKVEDDDTVGELGLLYKASQNLNINFRIDENFRFAKVDEFMQPEFAPPTFAPVILKTQTGVSYEASLNWKVSRFIVDLALFKLDLDNEIAFDTVNFANINIDSTSRKGMKLDLDYRLRKKLSLGLSGSLTDASIESGIFKDKDLPLVPEKQAKLYLNYAHSSAVSINTELLYTGDRIFSGDFNNVLSKLSGFSVMNVSGQYKVKNISYKIRVNNVLNEEYSEYGGLHTDFTTPFPYVISESFYPSPERNIVGSITVSF